MAKKRKFSPGDVVFNAFAGICDVVEVLRDENGKRRIKVMNVSGQFVLKPSHLHKAAEVFVPGCLYKYGNHIIQFRKQSYTGEPVGTVHRITNKIGYNLLRCPNTPYIFAMEGVVLCDTEFERLLKSGEIVPVSVSVIRLILLLRGY